MSTATFTDQAISIEDHPDDRPWPWTMQYDWTLFMPVSPKAKTLYMVLRSLLFDNAKNPDTHTRVLADRHLLFLMHKSVNGSVSQRSLYRWRKELEDADVLVVVPVYNTFEARPVGGRHTMSGRRYLVRRMPPKGYPVPYRSAWEVLHSEFPELRGNSTGPVFPASGSSPEMADQVTQVADQVSEMATHTPSDLGFYGSSNNSSKESSSSSISRARGRKAAGDPVVAARADEDEEEITSFEVPAQKPKNIDFEHVYAKLMEGLARNLPGRPDQSDIEEMLPHLCGALDAGWSPSAIREFLVKRCDLRKVSFPGRVYAKNAACLGEPTEEEMKGARIELCGYCDEVGRTAEPGWGSADPEANPLVCLHGEPDPWADDDYRTTVLAQRREAEEAAQRAQERLREEMADRKARMAAAIDRKATEAAQARAASEAGRGDRRRRAQEFLRTAGSLGDPDADAVRRALLTADDPAELDELDDLVDLGLGVVEEGHPVSVLEEILTAPREEWRSRMLDVSCSAPVG